MRITGRGSAVPPGHHRRSRREAGSARRRLCLFGASLVVLPWLDPYGLPAAPSRHDERGLTRALRDVFLTALLKALSSLLGLCVLGAALWADRPDRGHDGPGRPSGRPHPAPETLEA